MTTRMLPPALRAGATIGVLSPSSDEAGRFPLRRRRAVRFLESCGFRVKFAPGALRTGPYTAGDAQQRADDLHGLWQDQDVSAVIAAVGGNNSNQLLDLLDFDLIAANPKILVGCSDTCALLTAIWTRCGLTTFMGPQLMPQFGEVGGCLDYTLASFVGVLTRSRPPGVLTYAPAWTDERTDWAAGERVPGGPRKLRRNPGPSVLRTGSATGPVHAVNTDTLLRMAGTPYWPDLSGHILLLESSVPSPAVLDAQLTQLRQMGVLDTLAGLGFGRFPGTSEGPPEPEPDSLLRGVLRDFRGPVVAGLDIGHTDPMLTVPYGIRTHLSAHQEVRLVFTEAAVTDRGPARTTEAGR
ncbi:S66 family peptidase [Streptomyces sp. IBSNAI002]|uniref:S66 family peptidase n=1 Tax=Streptomyces sp. IBSNAI002 TaxID=3457500 RepID=UPI003FD4FE33